MQSKITHQGRRLCVFKVFIKYTLNLGSCCIYINVFLKSDLWQDINKAILLFFSAKIATFWDINA